MSVLHTNINEVVSLFVTEHGVTIITYVGDETESVSLNHDDIAESLISRGYNQGTD